MRKIIASASLAALGAASVHAAYAPGLSPMEQSKPWSIGLAVRGFYDDNYTTSPSSRKESSWGLSVSPSASVNKVWDQTMLGLSYIYDLRWYEDRKSNESDHIQRANLRFAHAFNERMDLKVDDSFYYGQEGTVDLGTVTTPNVLMTDADYVRNRANVDFSADVTESIGVRVGYHNEFYDYEQNGPGSRSALLDRMEHTGKLEGLWHFRPETSGVLGYQYYMVDHRSSDSIDWRAFYDPAFYLDPEVRDSRSHRVYVGAEHQASSTVEMAARIGGQFNDYPNADDLPGVDDSTITPFADARGTWNYNPGSFLQVGVIHTLNQTDVLALDQQSTAVWAMLNHRITPKLTGTAIGQFQYSSYNEGDYDGDADLLYLLGVNFNYQLNPYLAFEAGYNFDRLDSDLSNRSYSRNRGYVGVRATY